MTVSRVETADAYMRTIYQELLIRAHDHGLVSNPGSVCTLGKQLYWESPPDTPGKSGTHHRTYLFVVTFTELHHLLDCVTLDGRGQPTVWYQLQTKCSPRADWELAVWLAPLPETGRRGRVYSLPAFVFGEQLQNANHAAAIAAAYTNARSAVPAQMAPPLCPPAPLRQPGAVAGDLLPSRRRSRDRPNKRQRPMADAKQALQACMAAASANPLSPCDTESTVHRGRGTSVPVDPEGSQSGRQGWLKNSR